MNILSYCERASPLFVALFWVSLWCILSDRAVPCHIKFLRSQKVVHISCGDEHTAALTKVQIRIHFRMFNDFRSQMFWFILYWRIVCSHWTWVNTVFCCRSYRMEVCLHLVTARGGNWVTAPPAMSFYPDECWSWWVLRCPRSPVAGTFCSKLEAQWFILYCT